MKKLLMLGMSALLLTACGQTAKESGHEGHGTHTESKSVTPLTVDLKVPAKGKVGDKIKITATVKHGKAFVNDADEVMFEIIKDKDMKNSVKEKVKKAEKGVYTLEYTFKNKGHYNVISHVTAHNQHTMPNADITVE
ncbi:FixH family protein [Macrococcoides caseolyticum]|uniref:FixH family protein n=1 Tax=Macrococcoides caseolyticum TaxID=69966 RepID=UPI001F2F6455|nr:FixH family protein [Macrococcus caseolyticus]MCE4955865.1 FixH family protein [Macrococcus caseolyticus]